MNVCVSSSPKDLRCKPLKTECPEYTFVPIYAPGWPNDEEYDLQCSELYYAPLPLSMGIVLLIIIGIVIFAHCKKQSRRSDLQPILRLRKSSTRYGTLNELIIILLFRNTLVYFNYFSTLKFVIYFL